MKYNNSMLKIVTLDNLNFGSLMNFIRETLSISVGKQERRVWNLLQSRKSQLFCFLASKVIKYIID